jgi:DNA polymerase III delta prime subunit
MSNFNIFKRQLSTLLISASKPLIWLEAFDFRFVVEMIDAIGSNDPEFDPYDGSVLIWDMGFGSRLFGTSASDDNIECSLSNKIKDMFCGWGTKLLIAKVQKNTFEESPELVSLLQSFLYKNNLQKSNKKKTILLVSACHMAIEGLEHAFERLVMPLPDRTDILNELGFSNVVEADMNRDFIHGKYHFSFTFMREDVYKKNVKYLVNALLGMHLYDIRNLMQTIQSLSSVNVITTFDTEYGDLSKRIVTAKKQIVQNSGLLEIIDVEDKYEDNVGNIARLITYLKHRRNYIDNFNTHGKNLPLPKGILLVGEPGCGKSETAKAVASILKKPLLRLNMGGLLGQYVGQSENNFIEALRTAEAAQPCVLWIDEIEKAFAGTGKELGNNDVVMTRIIGIFLTWMQEHKSLVYLVATANDLSLMKDEFLRKGRWDEIFYLSKPDKDGIKDILLKCLNRYKLKLCNKEREEASSGEIQEIIELMDDMSGADIASVVIDTIQEVYGIGDNQYVYPYLPIHEIREKVRQIKKQKDNSEEERIATCIKRDILDFKIQDRKRTLDNEDVLKENLKERYRKKTKEELEYNYKAMGYLSAAKKES